MLSGRKPRIPIGEHAQILKAARIRQKLKSRLAKVTRVALAKKYGVNENVIAFIERGGRYRNFWRAYGD